MLVMGDMPLGKRAYWPIYATASGSADRHPCRQQLSQPADLGPVLGFLSRSRVAQATAFQTQSTSLIVEGSLQGIRD